MTQLNLPDEAYMCLAVARAQKGRGRVEPNPIVGAVIVLAGELVGEGAHERFGGPHAEANAIAATGDKCRGATLYVTLEPCTGSKKKTPPCCDAIINAGFERVVIGARDPTRDPAVPRLTAAGIAVTTGVLEEACADLIAPFLKLKQQGRPYVIAKWAMSADGKIATVSGDAKWISSEESRERVHHWRNNVNGVLVGAGTVRRDDPLLTCRIPDGRNPLRIVLDSQAALSCESRLVQTTSEAGVLVACHESAPDANRKLLEDAGCRVLPLPGENQRPDLAALLDALGVEELTNLLVEGGGEVLAGFFAQGLVDEVRIFIAPKLIGGASAPGPIAGPGAPSIASAIPLHTPTWTQIGDDMLLSGRVLM